MILPFSLEKLLDAWEEDPLHLQTCRQASNSCCQAMPGPMMVLSSHTNAVLGHGRFYDKKAACSHEHIMSSTQALRSSNAQWNSNLDVELHDESVSTSMTCTMNEIYLGFLTNACHGKQVLFKEQLVCLLVRYACPCCLCRAT